MKILILFFLLVLGSFFTSAQEKKELNVIGYVTDWSLSSNLSKIDYCNVSILNISFANPDANGQIKMGSSINLKSVSSYIKSINPNIKIYVAIAGASASQEPLKTRWLNTLNNETKRNQLIDSLVSFMEEYQFDGIDVDLEWGVVPTSYNPFLTKLSEKVKSKGLGITVALPNTEAFEATTTSLKTVDFVNIMSYDATGPWAPSRPGPHSSIDYAKSGINYWKNTMKIPENNLTLGVPFYGHKFGENPTSVMFSWIVSKNIENADIDKFDSVYYNGRPTIEKKIDLLVEENLGGIMIWQLGQDAFNEYSLLQTIDDKLKSLEIKTVNGCSTLSLEKLSINTDVIKAFKNKDGLLEIKLPSSYYSNADLHIFSSEGSELESSVFSDNETIISQNNKHSGLVIIQLEVDGKLYSEKIKL